MEVGSVLIIAALVVVAAAFIARPLVDFGAGDSGRDETAISSRKAELEHVLSLIQDLDMDYAMEKVQADDYAALRPELLGRGAALMREIDSLQGTNGAKPDEPSRPDLDAEIEARVARLRGGAGAAPAGFCGQCGQASLAGDRFCIRCGAPLTAEGARS
jgi:hypothetical protein